MLLLFAAKPALAFALRRAVPTDLAVTVVNDWPALTTCARRADCAVVLAPWLADTCARRALVELAADHLRLPLVLVTTKDADNARFLARLRVNEVVWLHELATQLWPAVRRARAATPFERAFALVASARPTQVAPMALLHAWRADPPIRSVTELAHALHCDRRTLWRRWHCSIPARLELRLEDVLDWVLLLRAVLQKDDQKSWSTIAAELGVHEQTLHRWARRLAGRGLGHFAPGDDQQLARQFVRRVVQPMLDCDAGDILQ